MTSQVLAYARTSTAEQSTLSQIQQITELYPDLDKPVFVDEGVSGTVPCLERPEFKRVADQLRKGDTLVVWWLDRLGRDYQDSKATAQALLKSGVTIKTINQSMTFEYTGETMRDSMTDQMLIMLTALAAAEKENRRASQDAGRAALKASGQWDEKYKGKRPNSGKMAGKHEEIAALIGEGVPMRTIAATVGVGLSTVQRVKKKMNLTPNT